ncbi:Anti-anti-sigma regulatory factor (antagonist of anti-sigma factor) [Amycolatopsis pretoriensis]|uniref:Anti-anti-sigma regulatory factor (Antagonist of anti-sigma factor) n=1 Tax=Amycolatopsis pretoriensis TaxID=218821 RepID=A0A1H5QEK4_9PSEU|nr:STAS domain-containing protein [Amycolatopsis pretoriensis]SEF24562.1 Anti-anti-sigma regulatory factor (antagonist of anti-sigma factor) [Amycolatopsis pretoriensis]
MTTRLSLALAELDRLISHATPPHELTLSSTLHPGRYTVVTIAGRADTAASRTLAGYLAGLVHAGSRNFLIDLSRVERPGDDFLRLLRRFGDWLTTAGGELELTGLTPPVLYELDDEPLAEVFTLYRVDSEGGRRRWAALRCPQGFDGVAEPGSPARFRAFVDTAATGRGERFGRRR